MLALLYHEKMLEQEVNPNFAPQHLLAPPFIHIVAQSSVGTVPVPSLKPMQPKAIPAPQPPISTPSNMPAVTHQSPNLAPDHPSGSLNPIGTSSIVNFSMSKVVPPGKQNPFMPSGPAKTALVAKNSLPETSKMQEAPGSLTQAIPPKAAHPAMPQFGLVSAVANPIHQLKLSPEGSLTNPKILTGKDGIENYEISGGIQAGGNYQSNILVKR
jgi:hypothetical protein